MTDSRALLFSCLVADLQFPLTRIVILGTGLFWFMGKAQARLIEFHDSPLLNVAIQIVMGLAAIGIYVAWENFIERREVTELSTPGLGREWGIGALYGAGALYREHGGSDDTRHLQGRGLQSSGLPAARAGDGHQVGDLRGADLPRRAVPVGRGHVRQLGRYPGVLAGVRPAASDEPRGDVGRGHLHLHRSRCCCSAAYLVTRRLWICMGFHMAWNYFQSAAFSGVVSGAVSDPGLLKANIEGRNC